MSEIISNLPIVNDGNRTLFAAQARVSVERSESGLSNRDLMPLVKMLAFNLQVPELTAFKLIRKFLATGQATNLNDLKKFLVEFIQEAKSNNNEALKNLRNSAKSEALQSDRELEKAFRPILKDMGAQFRDIKSRELRTSVSDLFNPRSANHSPTTQIPLPTNLSSPKEFASWLVNNKTAFIALKTNPQLTYLLLAFENPQLQKSPVMMAQIAKLVAQLIKLRQGKGLGDSSEEATQEIRNKESLQEEIDHEHNIVNTIKHTFENIGVNPMRDFLIEAERFAEEEIANLWSLTLKKEKQLEKQILRKLKRPAIQDKRVT